MGAEDTIDSGAEDTGASVAGTSVAEAPHEVSDNTGAQDVVNAAFESETSAPTDSADAGQPAEPEQASGDAPSEPMAASEGAPSSETPQPDISALFGQFEKMLAGQQPKADAAQGTGTPAAPAQETKPATPTTPSAAPGADPFADVLKAADEFGGPELSEKFAKPLIATFKTELAKQVKDATEQVTKQFAPAMQMAKAMEQVQTAQADKQAHDFFNKFPTVYGKDAKERLANPTFKQAFVEDVQKGSALQQFFASQGQQLSNADALAMAQAVRSKGTTVSQARQQVAKELKPRSNQRSVPPGRASAASGDGDWKSDATAAAAKFFE